MAKRRNYNRATNEQWLPSGFVTRDMNRYGRAWAKLCTALEKFLDKDCLAYNPGFLFEGGREPTRLASEDAIKIWELINKKKWKD
jgi:hypothetical protein